jgi:hypothetical protein
MTGGFFDVTLDEETARLTRPARQRRTQDAGLKAWRYEIDHRAHVQRRHVGHPAKKITSSQDDNGA